MKKILTNHIMQDTNMKRGRSEAERGKVTDRGPAPLLEEYIPIYPFTKFTQNSCKYQYMILQT